MNYFDKEGHLNDTGISLFSDAIKLKKREKLPQQLKEHVDSCEPCQHKVVDFAAIMADIKQADLMEHPTLNSVQKETLPQNQSGFRLLYKLAVAAIIGGLLFFGYQQFNQNRAPELVESPKEIQEIKEQPRVQEITPSNQEKLAEKEDKVPQIPSSKNNEEATPKEEILPKEEQDNKVLFAANYVENEELESMLGTVFRSEEFKIVSPGNKSTFKKGAPISFRWKDKVSLKFIILNNTEEERFVQTLDSNQFDFQTTFDPGIYYWKLETEDELLHLGKFIIE